MEDGHEICGVFTQPDKPKNRGHKLAFSPVKEYALSQGLTVYQPTKLRDGTALELIRTLAPELTVVAAYGRILPEDILAAPKLGSINVHSSLLPLSLIHIWYLLWTVTMWCCRHCRRRSWRPVWASGWRI